METEKYYEFMRFGVSSVGLAQDRLTELSNTV